MFSRHSKRRAAVPAALALLLGGCASGPADFPATGGTELADVPFFSQQRYQCGPAALAMALSHSGVAVDPDSLAGEVYLPGRRGSLQLEMIAATRRHGRIPYRVQAAPAGLLAELDAGNPVLILQNLGTRQLPVWHYAVAIGYDAPAHRIVLRSGDQQRRLMTARHFFRSWQLADNWGLVILPPDRLPATLEADAALTQLAASESLLLTGELRDAWEAALARWPGEPDLLFGAANRARMHGDDILAAARYRSLLEMNPDHLAARNNYADLLLARGCRGEARRQIDIATTSIGQRAHHFSSLIELTRREIDGAIAGSGTGDAGGCERL